jgi:hypothetical protein
VTTEPESTNSPALTRGVVGLDPGALVYALGELHEFVRLGCASKLGADCGHESPVTLRRVKPDGTRTMTMCFAADEVVQA